MLNLTRGEELTALIAVTVVGVAIAAVCLVKGDKGKTVEIPLNNPAEMGVQRGRRDLRGKIMVHISGEVRRKGVFELSAAARMQDAIELAGATENTDYEAMNLAAPLVDGERVVVPGKGMVSPGRGPLVGTKGTGKININTATQEQLESLPGIGSVIAGRIIEFRKTRRFDSVDDLLLINRIGPATLEKVREYVCVQ